MQIYCCHRSSELIQAAWTLYSKNYKDWDSNFTGQARQAPCNRSLDTSKSHIRNWTCEHAQKYNAKNTLLCQSCCVDFDHQTEQSFLHICCLNTNCVLVPHFRNEKMSMPKAYKSANSNMPQHTARTQHAFLLVKNKISSKRFWKSRIYRFCQQLLFL